MDAFFTISAPVPASEPASATQEFEFVDQEQFTASYAHANCVIA